jgi:hypothetical protein
MAGLLPAYVGAVGCGPRETYPVRGVVVFADTQQPAKELADYIVTFDSLERRVGGSSPIDGNGGFVLSTLRPGAEHADDHGGSAPWEASEVSRDQS